MADPLGLHAIETCVFDGSMTFCETPRPNRPDVLPGGDRPRTSRVIPHMGSVTVPYPTHANPFWTIAHPSLFVQFPALNRGLRKSSRDRRVEIVVGPLHAVLIPFSTTEQLLLNRYEAALRHGAERREASVSFTYVKYRALFAACSL